jgi:cytochrome c5
VTRAFAIAALATLLTACGGGEDTVAETTPAAPAGPTEVQMAQWQGSCALCHVDGTGGAPRVGVAADWAPRLAAGEDVLLAHTLEGFNNMPPLGYCMSCETDDFRALIRFMSQPGGQP